MKSSSSSSSSSIAIIIISGGSRGGARGAWVPSLFWGQTENWKAKNFFFETQLPPPPHPFSQGVYDRAPPLSEMLDPPLIIILLLLIFFSL